RRKGQRLLYFFRTPPGVRVGREALDSEGMRLLEQHNPDLVFDWDRLLKSGSPGSSGSVGSAGSPGSAGSGVPGSGSPGSREERRRERREQRRARGEMPPGHGGPPPIVSRPATSAEAIAGAEPARAAQSLKSGESPQSADAVEVVERGQFPEAEPEW